MMKRILLAIILSIVLGSCATRYVEVPVDKVKIEYRDRTLIDTIYRNDSTIIKEKGDTVFFERYKYIYKVKELKDTINITDTVTVVQTIEISKEVNKLRNWQIILMVIGGAGVALCGYKLIKLFKL